MRPSPLIPSSINSNEPSGLVSCSSRYHYRTKPYSYSTNLISSPSSSLAPGKTAASQAAVNTAPFSLDAALKGTIPSYAARAKTSSNASSAPISVLAAGKPVATVAPEVESGMKDSWFFAIHEDTPDQEMTNLLQHSTCTLDISSDEEVASRYKRERDEGRDKENVPPTIDVSQTSAGGGVVARRPGVFAAAAVDVGMQRAGDAMLTDTKLGDGRIALREMDAREFFARGCDERSVFVVPADDDEHDLLPVAEPQVAAARQLLPPQRQLPQYQPHPAQELDNIPADNVEHRDAYSASSAPTSSHPASEPVSEADLAVEQVMQAEELLFMDDDPGADDLAPTCRDAATLLGPAEDTVVEEAFELWESGSTRDENEQVSATPEWMAEIFLFFFLIICLCPGFYFRILQWERSRIDDLCVCLYDVLSSNCGAYFSFFLLPFSLFPFTFLLPALIASLFFRLLFALKPWLSFACLSLFFGSP